MLLEKIKDKFETPEDKAWKYCRELLDDDEKYIKLRTKNEHITIKGSDGGEYVLYPNGEIVRLDKAYAKLGRISKTSRMPLPDHFSALIVWIKYNEKELKRRWGCGNISFIYNEQPSNREIIRDVEPLYEIGREEPVSWNVGPVSTTDYYPIGAFSLCSTIAVAGTFSGY